MQQRSQSNETPWNMNQDYLMQLGRRRDEKALAKIEGDLWKWYRCNIEIADNISAVIDEKEFDDIQKILDELKTHLMAPENTGNYAQFKQTGKLNRLTTAEVELQKLDKQLMKLMFKHQLIYIRPKPKDVEEYLAEDDFIN